MLTYVAGAQAAIERPTTTNKRVMCRSYDSRMLYLLDQSVNTSLVSDLGGEKGDTNN